MKVVCLGLIGGCVDTQTWKVEMKVVCLGVNGGNVDTQTQKVVVKCESSLS